MEFIQINLHHREAATALLYTRCAMGKIRRASIQDPKINMGRITDLNSTTEKIYFASNYNSGSFIYIRNHNLELCSRDPITVKVTRACMHKA
jgi:hypothetical protein